MDQIYVLAAGFVALVFTLAWLYVHERVTVSGTVAFLLWGYLALQGGDATVVDDTGAQQAVPVPDELRLILAALSVLSLLAVVLWTLGVYPPETEGESADKSKQYAMDNP